MYKLVALVSFLLRNYVLPNPFDKLSHKIMWTVGPIQIALPHILLSMLVEVVLCPFTFAVVGIYYKKGIDSPVFGSVLYFLFYMIHLWLISLMAMFNFTTLSVIIVFLAYASCHITFLLVRNKFRFMYPLGR